MPLDIYRLHDILISVQVCWGYWSHTVSSWEKLTCHTTLLKTVTFVNQSREHLNWSLKIVFEHVISLIILTQIKGEEKPVRCVFGFVSLSQCCSAGWTQRALSLLYKRWRSRTFSSSSAGTFDAKNRYRAERPLPMRCDTDDTHVCTLSSQLWMLPNVICFKGLF